MMKKSLMEVAALAAQFTHSPAPRQAQSTKSTVALSPAERLKDIICNLGDIDDQDYRPEANLKDDLMLDSLDLIEMVMVCEKEFRISIADLEWMKARTVSDMLRLIESHYRPQQSQAA